MKNREQITNYIKENGLKYYVVTYGCQMNEHESEKLRGTLEEVGYLPAQDKESADFIIFNTCCIRDNAEQKTFGNVGALKKQKEQNPQLMIAVCGCMTQQEEVAKKMSVTFPFVDIIFGTHNLHSFSDMIIKRLSQKKRVLDVYKTEGEIFENVPVKRKSGPLCSVNIMYGCNNFCSYCIVPYVRGRERSRKVFNIIQEINDLCAQGFSEVMLLGQNVNSYNDGINFPQLLKQICENTKISRIRFMTSHPKDLSEELITVIRDYPQVCKHIHLPVQSGSTKILADMNRGYTREHYLNLVNKIRKEIPEIVLTTDIIVGFPGESDSDFADTVSLVEEVGFDSAFTFVYSVRTGTAAAKMQNFVPKEIQTERIMKLIDIQNDITEEKNKAFSGKTVRVLAEDVSTRNEEDICGRADCGKMVNFKGTKADIGKFFDIHITEAKRTTLFGEIVG